MPYITATEIRALDTDTVVAALGDVVTVDLDGHVEIDRLRFRKTRVVLDYLNVLADTANARGFERLFVTAVSRSTSSNSGLTVRGEIGDTPVFVYTSGGETKVEG